MLVVVPNGQLGAACCRALVAEPGGGLVDPAGMTTVEQFLTEKAALPAPLRVVA